MMSLNDAAYILWVSRLGKAKWDPNKWDILLHYSTVSAGGALVVHWLLCSGWNKGMRESLVAYLVCSSLYMKPWINGPLAANQPANSPLLSGMGLWLLLSHLNESYAVEAIYAVGRALCCWMLCSWGWAVGNCSPISNWWWVFMSMPLSAYRYNKH